MCTDKKIQKQAGAELGQAQLKLAFELSLTLVKICCIGLYNLLAYLPTCLLAYLVT